MQLICAHLLIDAPICQFVIKHVFTNEELDQMRSCMEKVANEKMGAKHTAPVVAVLSRSLKESFKGLLKEEEHQHFGCSTTTWSMSSRSSLELKGLQTIMDTFPVLLLVC